MTLLNLRRLSRATARMVPSRRATVGIPHPRSGSDRPTLDIVGVPVDRITLEDALDRVERLLDSSGPSLLFYVNAHSVNVAQRDVQYLAAVRRADLVLNDGVGVTVAARLNGTPITHNLNGTDFTPQILQIAARLRLRVFFLGGKPGVAEEAAEHLTAAIPGLRVVGVSHGYLDDADQSLTIDRIRRAKTDLLVVGLGCPEQELWLDRNVAATAARLGVAVGGFLDFASGRAIRAPEWVRWANMEWGWRLANEPTRLFRRYVMGNPAFLSRVLLARFVRSRPPVGPERASG